MSNVESSGVPVLVRKLLESLAAFRCVADFTVLALWQADDAFRHEAVDHRLVLFVAEVADFEPLVGVAVADVVLRPTGETDAAGGECLIKAI